MERTYKIMTFNLRVLVPSDPFPWRDRKHWIRETIVEYQPDVIGLQELTPPMLTWLTTEFQTTYEIFPVNRIDSDSEGEFLAILAKKSSFTMGEKGAFMLSETPNDIGSMGWDAHYPRICNWTELHKKETNEPIMTIFNTHLDHIGQLAREKGLALIQNMMKNTKLPTLLTGDFNATPENTALKAVNGMQSCYSTFTEEQMENSLTFHNYKGGTTGQPIDYIFAGTGTRITQTAIIKNSYDQGYPSDHYPVISTIDVTI
ncbi:endonuclease/exonuclease/phosphatase family protein [Bacillus sp. THAF10]|uniref:endonuclease/exonuclease/phosphatase family protein n=1 Tax=Bacillus sp. THAF10 TaxID=2587848 RepID=UPI001562BE2D|nr:endonuclease/exonuclease/phosphatase family protein [Bacillus sp. THAF10]